MAIGKENHLTNKAKSQAVTVLNSESYDRLVAQGDNPPAPTSKMIEAARRFIKFNKAR